MILTAGIDAALGKSILTILCAPGAPDAPLGGWIASAIGASVAALQVDA
jgi:hypothetical protein